MLLLLKMLKLSMFLFHEIGLSYSCGRKERRKRCGISFFIYVAFLTSLDIKQSNSLHFKPFKLLANYSAVLDQIEYLISVKDHQAAMTLSENLRSLALQGLHYFQTYDWLMLMTVITLGYIGWMINLVLHILQSYTSLPGNMLRKEPAVRQRNYTRKVKRLNLQDALGTLKVKGN